MQIYVTSDFLKLRSLIFSDPNEPDLRDDKQFFIDHPGAVPITTAQVKNYASHVVTDCAINFSFEFFFFFVLLKYFSSCFLTIAFILFI